VVKTVPSGRVPVNHERHVLVLKRGGTGDGFFKLVGHNLKLGYQERRKRIEEREKRKEDRGKKAEREEVEE
jgi:hypothetical protein